MNNPFETIQVYAYGAEAVAKSWISLQELEQLKISVGFTAEDERYLRLAGEVTRRNKLSSTGAVELSPVERIGAVLNAKKIKVFTCLPISRPQKLRQ